MQRALRRGIAIFIFLLALTPVSYLVVAQSAAVTAEVSPLLFVPQNSSEAISINEGHNQLIIFASSTESGYVIKSSPWFLYSLIKHHNLNVSTNITFSKVTDYMSVPVYKLSNVQPLSLVLNSSLRSSLAKLNVTSTTVSPLDSAIFFSNPETNIFILGSLNTVKSSLHQYLTHKGPNQISSSLNITAGISFVIRSPVQGYIEMVSGNLTGSVFAIMVHFSQSLYTADFFGAYLLSLLGKGIVIVPINPLTDEMLVNLNSIQYIPIFSLLQNSMGAI